MTATDDVRSTRADAPATAAGGEHPWYVRMFEIDLRALAALRIGFALVTLWDLGSRSFHLVELYTDVGVAPRSLFTISRASRISLYNLSGSPVWAITLFVVHAILALMLLVGYHTRLALAGCIILGWSLAMRNVPLLHGGDGLMLWAMFWSLFLPLEAIASVDSRTAEPPPSSPRAVFSAASVALLVQVVLVYIGAVTVKTHPAWASQLAGVYYFMSSHWGTPLGHELTRIAPLMKVMNIATIALEWTLPMLAVISAPLPWLRALIALAMMFFHLLLGITLYVGTFPAVCAIVWIPFLPGEFWNALASCAPIRAIGRAWARFIDALSAAIRAIAPKLIVRRIHFAPGRAVSVFVGALLAYAVLVVVVYALPVPIGSRLEPLLVLGGLKQGWGVMGEPPYVWARMGLDAKLVDGSVVTLIDATAPERAPRRFLIPPRDLRVMKYQLEIMIQAQHDQPKFAEAFCRATARAWDASHPPDKRIASLTILYNYHETRPLGMPSSWPVRQGQTPAYTWLPPAGVP